MRMYLISDNIDTQTGMRLAGVEGVVVHTQKEVEEAISRVLEQKDIGILLITEILAKQFPQEITKIKLGRPLPLVVEIPDRHGTGRAPDSITSYVRDAIGVRV